MKFLADENFPFSSIKMLREHGLSVRSILEEETGISDERVMEIALENDLIILTFDSDYGTLIFRDGHSKPPAVIYFRDKQQNPAMIAALLLKLLTNEDIVLLNSFTVVEHNNIRQRKY